MKELELVVSDNEGRQYVVKEYVNPTVNETINGLCKEADYYKSQLELANITLDLYDTLLLGKLSSFPL